MIYRAFLVLYNLSMIKKAKIFLFYHTYNLVKNNCVKH